VLVISLTMNGIAKLVEALERGQIMQDAGPSSRRSLPPGTGSMNRSDRVAKDSRLLRIEGELDDRLVRA
jgi:hypothetical protein